MNAIGSRVTKAELLARSQRLERENEPLALALHDLVAGQVHWFGRSPYRLGISRPTGGAGGIVIASAFGSTSAHYWETWSAEQLATLAHLITGQDNEDNRERLRRRSVIEEAQAWIREEQRRK